jgi:hypothetical protein
MEFRSVLKMFFARVNFLANSFNSAIGAAGHTAALGMTAGTMLSAADDKKNKKGQGVENGLKLVAKMSLLGMLM